MPAGPGGRRSGTPGPAGAGSDIAPARRWPPDTVAGGWQRNDILLASSPCPVGGRSPRRHHVLALGKRKTGALGVKFSLVP